MFQYSLPRELPFAWFCIPRIHHWWEFFISLTKPFLDVMVLTHCLETCTRFALLINFQKRLGAICPPLILPKKAIPSKLGNAVPLCPANYLFIIFLRTQKLSIQNPRAIYTWCAFFSYQVLQIRKTSCCAGSSISQHRALAPKTVCVTGQLPLHMGPVASASTPAQQSTGQTLSLLGSRDDLSGVAKVKTKLELCLLFRPPSPGRRGRRLMAACFARCFPSVQSYSLSGTVSPGLVRSLWPC